MLVTSCTASNTNAAERAAAKAIYNLVIEPAVNAGLSITPASLPSAAGIQAVSTGGAREAFVTAVAGPKEGRGSGGRGGGRPSTRSGSRGSTR